MVMFAARTGCIACAELLLAAGADIDLPDPDGVSPLHLGLMNANWDIAKRLIEAGADVILMPPDVARAIEGK